MALIGLRSREAVYEPARSGDLPQPVKLQADGRASG